MMIAAPFAAAIIIISYIQSQWIGGDTPSPRHPIPQYKQSSLTLACLLVKYSHG
jgi:hypothetical protein